MASIVGEVAAVRGSSARRMTVPQGAALSVGAVLGTGVIALPALAAQIAGPASLIAWVALVLLSAPLAITFAALGARYPDSGGVSTYVRTAFGRRTAAVVGWCFFFTVPAASPAAAMFGGAYVASATGGGTTTSLVVAGVAIVIVGATNAGGLRVSGRVQLALAGLLATMLLIATISALPHARVANLHPFAPNGWGAIGPAAALLVWGFAGWEAVTHLAADFGNPKRDVPRATAIAVVVVGVLYLGVATASILVLGPKTGSSAAPLADLLAIGIGGQARVLTAVAAMLLTLGAMNAYFAGAAKLGAALGRDGALPPWLADGSQAGEVPRRSLGVICALSFVSLAVVWISGVGPRASVLLATGSFVLVYVLGMAAAIRLLPRGSWARRAAAVALASVLVLVVMTGIWMVGSIVVAAAALTYQRVVTRRQSGDSEKLRPGVAG